jgi:hypothetical protein
MVLLDYLKNGQFEKPGAAEKDKCMPLSLVRFDTMSDKL